MPSFWFSPTSLLTFVGLCFLLTTSAQGDGPRLAFAINSQLPPVAYVDQPYEFVFSADTFTSTNGQTVTYSLSTGPDWLSVDSANRRLAGKPAAENVGAVTLQLVAATEGGSTVSEVTLVVLERRALTANRDVLAQLDVVGQTSTPASLLLRPLEPFSLSISKGTFDGVSDITQFYAVTADGSPLPAWMQFDPSAVRFSGRTPPLPASVPDRQTFAFTLAASDVVGFSEAAIHFQITVTTRVLAFSPSHQTVRIAKEDTVYIASLLDRLTLDGESVARTELSSVEVSSAPAWLTLDDSDLSCKGVVPPDAESSVFVISVTGPNNEAANASIILQVDKSPAANETSLGTYSVSAGTDFTYTIQGPRGFDGETVNAIDFDPGQTAAWLRLETTNLTLYGTVPAQQRPGEYEISIVFSYDTLVSFNTLVINVTAGTSTKTRTTAAVSPTDKGGDTSMPTSTLIPSSPTGANDPWTPHEKLMLGLKIGLPLFGVALLIGVAVCVRRRRQRSRTGFWPWPRTSAAKSASGVDDGGGGEEAEEEKDAQEAISNDKQHSVVGSGRQAEEGAPQVELPWAPDSLVQAHDRLSKKRKLDQPSELASSWDDLISPSLSAAEDGLAALPVVSSPRRRQSATGFARTGDATGSIRSRHTSRPAMGSARRPAIRPRSHRSPTTSSSFHTAYLPQRMSGAGHGAGFGSVLYGQDTRSSWYTTFGSMPLAEGGSRPHTVLLTAFPMPPSQSDTMATVSSPRPDTRDNDRLTLRLVTTPSDDVGIFEDARQKYYAERARDQLVGASRFASKTSTPPTGRVLSPSNRPDKHLPTTEKSPYRRAKQRSFSTQWSPSLAARPASLQRQMSAASSGQFDSALSSESQWEDDVFAPDETAFGKPGRYAFDESSVLLEEPLTATATGPAKRLRLATPPTRAATEATGLRHAGSRQHDSPRFV